MSTSTWYPKTLTIRIVMNELLYECIANNPTGKEYNLCHHWRALKTFFGFIHAYQCENCKIKLSKKQFIAGNYHIYDKIEHL